MFNKQTILAVAAVACMASATSAFAAEQPASLHRDSAGQLHYIPLKASQTVMTAADIDSHGNWIVPGEVLATKGSVRPVHEILQLTESEFMVYNQGEGGQMPNRHVKADSPVVTLHQIHSTFNTEVDKMNDNEFERYLNRFYGGGNDQQ